MRLGTEQSVQGYLSGPVAQRMQHCVCLIMRSAPPSYPGADTGSWLSYLPISHTFGAPCPLGPTQAKTSLCTSSDTL